MTAAVLPAITLPALPPSTSTHRDPSPQTKGVLPKDTDLTPVPMQVSKTDITKPTNIQELAPDSFSTAIFPANPTSLHSRLPSLTPTSPTSRETPSREIPRPKVPTTLTLITPAFAGHFTVIGGLTKTIITTLLATGKAPLITISHASAGEASATQAYASLTNTFLTSMAIATALYRAATPQTFDYLVARVLAVQALATQVSALITDILATSLAAVTLTHISGTFLSTAQQCASVCSTGHFFFLSRLAFLFLASPLLSVPPP